MMEELGVGWRTCARVVQYTHMAKKFVHKLRRVSTHSYALTIPKDLIDKYGWRERQKIEIIAIDGKPEIVIRDWKK